MNFRACIDELSKLGAVTDEQAQAALNRVDTLERTKTTPERALRYAAVGAAAAPAIAGVANMVKGKGFTGGLKGLQYARDAAGDALRGGIATGALPLVQQHFDRQHEMKTLRKYIDEGGNEETT